jgi:ubiquinone/menaquinone biosynthesis C-methylase UbiE
LDELLGRRFAGLAFGPAARVYEALTGSPAWSRSCRRLAELVPGPRVLDLGVGPGASSLEGARADPRRRAVGLDRSATMLRRAARLSARQGRPMPLLRADAQVLPIRTGALDGVTGHSLLYLLPDPAAALAEVARAVRAGGRVAFLEPSCGHHSLRSALADGPRLAASMIMWRVMSGLHRRFTAEELGGLLRGAGFREVRVEATLAGYGLMADATR